MREAVPESGTQWLACVVSPRRDRPVGGENPVCREITGLTGLRGQRDGSRVWKGGPLRAVGEIHQVTDIPKEWSKTSTDPDARPRCQTMCPPRPVPGSPGP